MNFMERSHTLDIGRDYPNLLVKVLSRADRPFLLYDAAPDAGLV